MIATIIFSIFFMIVLVEAFSINIIKKKKLNIDSPLLLSDLFKPQMEMKSHPLWRYEKELREVQQKKRKPRNEMEKRLKGMSNKTFEEVMTEEWKAEKDLYEQRKKISRWQTHKKGFDYETKEVQATNKFIEWFVTMPPDNSADNPYYRPKK